MLYSDFTRFQGYIQFHSHLHMFRQVGIQIAPTDRINTGSVKKPNPPQCTNKHLFYYGRLGW